MRSRLAALVVAFAIGSLLSGVAFAAVSRTIPNDGVFYACYDPGGSVKLIDYSVTQTCPKGWTGPVAWNQSGVIGLREVFLGAEFLTDNHNLQAFIPTGSASGACLVTLNELTVEDWPLTPFCNARSMEIDGVLTDGMRVIVLFPNGITPPPIPEAVIGITVYHEGAQYYGDPVPYDGG